MRRLATLTIVLLVALGACGDSAPEELSGFVRTPLPEVGGLELPDASNGETSFPLQAADDGILVVYFGYTSCPDVCPTTMADLRKALQELGGDADRVSVAMTTIDPDRDTPEVLTGYVQTFIPDGHALRTEDDTALRTVADVFGADYSVDTADDGDIDVMHTGSLYAVDPDGRLLVTWPFGIPSETIARDLRILFDSV